MYRPTVRYDDVYKVYVENICNSTHLDKNQIIRAALFIAGHTEKFTEIVTPFLKKGMSLPLPLWGEEQDVLWLKQKANDAHELSIVEEVVQQQQRNYQPNKIEVQPMASPKVFKPGADDVSIQVGRRQYSPRL